MRPYLYTFIPIPAAATRPYPLMITNLLDRVKFPFRKDKELLSALHDILGFYPHNLEIYRVAFAHRSLSYRSKDRRNQETGRPLNNERLEYLGDAVLETVVSDIVYHHFDRRREGFLTATRSKVVSRETLNRLSEEMNILKLVRAAQGISTNHTNIGGNAFEALMGAIYLDRGFRYCRWFIEKRVMGRFIDLDKLANKEVNFKSKLLEWSQKNRINTAFNMEGGTGGERVFFTTVVIEGLVAGKGKGLSKKESQQIAAKEALTKLRREPLFLDSVFQAKEQRTAMEAEEAFALPHIDEIEDILTKEQGKGSKPKATDRVKCHYEGRLTDGTVFDSSYRRGEPAVFPLNGVIAGWTEGVQLMAEGAKFRFFIPYSLAYGERGAGQSIPPYAALVFDVELIEVVK